jgi:hypothetical protein
MRETRRKLKIVKINFVERVSPKKEGDRHTAFNKIQKSRDPAGIKNLAGIIKIHRISPENPKSVQSKSG